MNSSLFKELYRIINYCENQYESLKSGKSDGKEYCPNNCGVCIKRYYNYSISPENKKDYLSCTRMPYYYVKANFPRYVTETYFLMDWMFRNGRFGSEANVLSIGCGPCSEAYGFYYAQKQNKFNGICRYFGYDLMTGWNDVCDINKSLLCNDLFEYMVSFEDVYDMDVSVSNKIDCVFLNYMLSHMAHFNNDSIEVFVNKLVKFVLCNNIHTILYNDIPYVSDNRHWGYHWLEYIAEKLSSDGYKLAKYSYNPNLYSDRKGVVRIENKWPSFVSDNINDACSSISCIIYL